MYLFDTDHAIALIKKSPSVLERISTLKGDALYATTFFTLSELYFGAYHSKQFERNLRSVETFQENVVLLPFDICCAKEYGHIRSELFKKGIPLDDNDLYIGATALCGNHILLTHNRRHFQRIPGLHIEDWLGNKTSRRQ